jgi:insertion element IS1 protein InsB
MWSFAGSKKCRWWVWVALDAGTRQVVAMVAGRRDAYTARCLWEALPDEYRERAITCTDLLEAYRAVVPDDRHARAGKAAGITCHIERFWATVRARCARFVRKTLSFSKCEWNHVGSLWYFVRQYNASRA